MLNLILFFAVGAVILFVGFKYGGRAKAGKSGKPTGGSTSDRATE